MKSGKASLVTTADTPGCPVIMRGRVVQHTATGKEVSAMKVKTHVQAGSYGALR